MRAGLERRFGLSSEEGQDDHCEGRGSAEGDPAGKGGSVAPLGDG